jgi:hypothetical protein
MMDVPQSSPTPLQWWIARSPSHQGTQEDTIETMYRTDTRLHGNKGNTVVPFAPPKQVYVN